MRAPESTAPFPVSAEELIAVVDRLVKFAVADEGAPLGHVRLQVLEGSGCGLRRTPTGSAPWPGGRIPRAAQLSTR